MNNTTKTQLIDSLEKAKQAITKAQGAIEDGNMQEAADQILGATLTIQSVGADVADAFKN